MQFYDQTQVFKPKYWQTSAYQKETTQTLYYLHTYIYTLVLLPVALVLNAIFKFSIHGVCYFMMLFICLTICLSVCLYIVHTYVCCKQKKTNRNVENVIKKNKNMKTIYQLQIQMKTTNKHCLGCKLSVCLPACPCYFP